jgi:hypothetical protein
MKHKGWNMNGLRREDEDERRRALLECYSQDYTCIVNRCIVRYPLHTKKYLMVSLIILQNCVY